MAGRHELQSRGPEQTQGSRGGKVGRVANKFKIRERGFEVKISKSTGTVEGSLVGMGRGGC